MAETPYDQAVTAIREEDCDTLRTLLQGHPELSSERDPEHRDYTLLLHAGHYYSGEIIRLLIGAGSDVHATSRDGATPFSNAIAKCESGNGRLFIEAGYAPRNLREAAGGGDLARVQSFFDDDGELRPDARAHREINPHNGWIDAELSDEPTSVLEEALSFASRNGETEVASYLLDRGAAGGTTDSLFLACLADNLDTVKMLVSRGGDVNERKPDGNSTPLDWAHTWGADKVRAWMVEEAPLDLMLAVEHGATARVRKILDEDPAQANVGFDSDYPLHAAAWEDRRDLAVWLLEAGADPTLANGRGMTPVHTATNLLRDELLRTMADHGVELDFLAAVVVGDDQRVRDHLSRGAAVDSCTAAGHSALAIAVGLDHATVMATLEAAAGKILGAKTERRGVSPLHRAVKDDRPQAARRLLAAGVAPDAEAPMQLRPLHVLHDAITDLDGMIEILVDGGADLDAAEFFGNTPLDWTAARGHEKASAALRDVGGRRFCDLPLEKDSPQ